MYNNLPQTKALPSEWYWFLSKGLLWVSLTPYKLHAFIVRSLSTRWILGVRVGVIRHNGVEVVNLQPGLIALELWEGFPRNKCSAFGLKPILFHFGEWEEWYPITLTFSKRGKQFKHVRALHSQGGKLIKTVCVQERAHRKAGRKDLLPCESIKDKGVS